MRWAALTIILVFFTASAVGATDLTGTRGPVKGNSHVGMNPGQPDGREGGETIEDAVVIPTLPYIDTGNTCDNLNNYDEMCPYDAMAPDVVYAYAPTEDTVIDIDLCSNGNQYDTKIIVYENSWIPGNWYACNDDACSNDWTPYASQIPYLFVSGGNTYYIVIDGYGSDCGNYELLVQQSSTQNVECGPEHVPEGEPDLVDDYIDNHNGGCNNQPPVFQDINWIDGSGCAHLCGVSGWYDVPIGLYRDTDWFPVVAAGSQIDVAIISEWYTQILVSDANPDCETATWHIIDCFDGYSPQTYSIATNSGDVHWIWVGPCEWVDMPDFIYTLEVCGIQYETVATATTSWGAVKALYK